MVRRDVPGITEDGDPNGPADRVEETSAMSVVRPLARGDFEVKFLTVAEVAVIMRVSKMTVYRLVHAGDLVAMRVGRSYRVPERAVQDYLRHSYLGSTIA
jgi:excisionase family DNA binding protein